MLSSDGQDGSNTELRMRVILSQIIPVAVKGFLLIGYGTSAGFPTILIPNLSNCNIKEELCLNEDQISWIGSILLLTQASGCLISGVVSQVFGRKITMQSCSILIIISSLIFRFCNDVWQIYVALIISGFSGGLLESPVLTYVAEICQPSLRGTILPLGAISSNIGTVLVFLLGSLLYWKDVALCCAVAPTICFLLLFLVPESPHWLIAKNKLQQAKNSLAWVRGWTTVEEVETEFKCILISNSAAPESTNKMAFNVRHYLRRECVHPFLLISCLFFYYNFSGSQSIPVYAIQIFGAFQVPIDEYYATIFLGLSQLLGCLTCILVIKHTGRRIITFLAITIAMFSMITIGLYAYLTSTKYLFTSNEISQYNNLNEYNWIPLLCIFLAAFSIDCGIRNVVWALVSECFSMNTRAVATGTLGTLSYLLGFVSSKTFLALVTAITLSGVLWFYAAIALFSLIILYFWLPETEGKTLQEITNYFAGDLKLANNSNWISRYVERILCSKSSKNKV